MFLWFPIDNTNAYGEGHGPAQHPRAGAIRWLRLAVDPNDSGALAPKLRGMSEAIFVRIKRADDDPRAIDDGGLAP